MTACDNLKTEMKRFLGFAFCGLLLLIGCKRDSSSAGASSMNDSSPYVKYIGDAQFEAEVTKAASPVVVEFYATWCEPCKVQAPIIEEIAASSKNRIKFVKMNFDEARATAKQFNIEGVPTLLLFKNGKLADTIIALQTADDLKKRIGALTGSESTTNAPM
jgi:thioredoxin 1